MSPVVAQLGAFTAASVGLIVHFGWFGLTLSCVLWCLMPFVPVAGART